MKKYFEGLISRCYKIWRSKLLKRMKIVLFLLTIGITQTFALEIYSQNTRLTLNVSDESIINILEEIEGQTEFFFMFDASVIDVYQRKSIECKNQLITDILNQLLGNTGIDYKISDRQIVLTKQRTVKVEQQSAIKGKVTDTNGSPLPGVNVVEKGTTNGTVTNLDGEYSIPVSSPDAILSFSYVGYLTEEVEVGDKTSIDISLVEDIQSLDEVVVIGYGVQKKVNLTGAVSSISNDELESKPVANVVEAIQGTAPGLIIEQSTSTPGSSPSILIRGLNTMNNNNPLVLVDGIVGDIQNVAPEDIDQISVLKDAASTAIYGSRASNGIILITTKKGSKDKKEVTYNFNYGWQTPTSIPTTVDSWTYAEMYNEAQINSGREPKFTEQDIEDFRNNGPNVKWMDEIYRTGPQQSHTISFTGGSNTTTYLISAGYLNQESMWEGPNFNYDRYNSRVNLSNQVLDKLKITTTLSYVRNQKTEPATFIDQVVRQSLRMPPFYPVVDENGDWTTPSGSNSNAVARLYESGYSQVLKDDLSGTLSADLQLLEGLKLTGMVGGQLISKQVHTNRKAIHYVTPGAGDNINSITEEYARTQDITANLLLNYDKKFGNHSLSATAGYSYEGERYRWFTTSRTLEEAKYDVLGGSELKGEDVGNSGAGNDWALYSAFGRVNYNFSERYLLEVNVRDDISSKFRKGNRSSIFPSFSAGWRISEEQFFEPVKQYLSYLKLRGSWGLVGNDRIGLYQYMANVSVSQSYMFGDALVNTSDFSSSNPDLKWETTRMADVGADLGFLNDKLNLTFDYFHNLTSDILVNLPVSSVFGSDAPIQNAGAVKTYGWELAINYQQRTGNFEHRVSANLSDSKNEVVDNGGRINISSESVNTIIQEGYPLWSYYGYRSDGFFQNEDEVTAGPHLDGITPKPGDIRYVDKNEDGIIKEDDDRFIIGNRYPRYTFGFTYGVKWKGIDFSMFWQGVGQREVWLSGVATMAFANNFEGPVYDFHMDRWTPDNTSASYPRLTMGAESNNNKVKSDFWLEDAAYLRLKNIQLGYTLPENLTQKVFIKNLRLYTSVQNALTFSDTRGWDPEVAENNGALYAVARVISVGLNVKF